MCKFNSKYPSTDYLRERARQKIPKFAFEYLDGGCNEDVNLLRNNSDLANLELRPIYLKDFKEASMETSLFGHTYSAPFGIAPVGLQGLIWPNSPEILAKAATEQNIPFILSTVSTSSIEKIMDITGGKAWYQLYHPAEEIVKDDILDRAEQAGCEVLVILCDVPSFGFRPKDISNGLAMPPKMSVKNFIQIFRRPDWALNTLMHGQPSFETLKPYMPKGMSMKQLGLYMNKTFSGRLNEERISKIRDRWKGKVVLKGVSSEEDAEVALRLGLDGIIISNHGGRQLDAAESSIKSLMQIAPKYKEKFTVMMDSGIRTGPDIARSLASGAAFTFLGRTFMYGVGALGRNGGEHTICMLKTQLKQVMQQLGCEDVRALESHLSKAYIEYR